MLLQKTFVTFFSVLILFIVPTSLAFSQQYDSTYAKLREHTITTVLSQNYTDAYALLTACRLIEPEDSSLDEHIRLSAVGGAKSNSGQSEIFELLDKWTDTFPGVLTDYPDFRRLYVDAHIRYAHQALKESKPETVQYHYNSINSELDKKQIHGFKDITGLESLYYNLAVERVNKQDFKGTLSVLQYGLRYFPNNAKMQDMQLYCKELLDRGM